MATILVIDDDDALRGTLRACLERREYTVYEARHGQEGVACCEAHAIAVVLTDLLMPEQEGLETIQHLRAMDPPPKIIAMSGGGATGQLNFLQAATAFGADRTFQKPTRARDLLDRARPLGGHLAHGMDDAGASAPGLPSQYGQPRSTAAAFPCTQAWRCSAPRAEALRRGHRALPDKWRPEPVASREEQEELAKLAQRPHA
jgi:CheY-like chemotaxis protein